MTPEQRRARLAEILNQHDEIARALRESSHYIDKLLADARPTLPATSDPTYFNVIYTHLLAANGVQRIAIDAMLAANRAALALFNED